MSFKFEEQLGDEWADFDFDNIPTNLLTTRRRSHLVRNTGDEVDVYDHVDGKTVGLYFAVSSHDPCHYFTSKLVNVYNNISVLGGFEIVYISPDDDECSFTEEFSKMPWLAVPHSDSVSRDMLIERFKVTGFPHLVFVNENGRVLSDDGVTIIGKFGAEGYPFTPQHLEEITEQEEAAQNNQSLQSILVSHSRDFVHSADERVVPVTELQGKTIGLYFSLSSYNKCFAFTKKLAGVYKELKERKESFEIVSIPLEDDEESFKKGRKVAPWLSLPFCDKSCEKLCMYFEISSLPSLVILGADGKTINPNVAEAIEQYGIRAYPFTSERVIELAEIEKIKPQKQTLESILVSGDRDFLMIKKDGIKVEKVPVSHVRGKTILLYFSALWCPVSIRFFSLLKDMYDELTNSKQPIEIIFISLDRNKALFDNHFSKMPWLALPFGDSRNGLLIDLFKIRGIPQLAAVGPSGETLTTEARDLVCFYGSKSYPFTEGALKEMEDDVDKVCRWPKKVKSQFHLAHELALNYSRVYICHKCKQHGSYWVYSCKDCEERKYNLHPWCAGVRETYF